ncbi:MAG TPA: hypothetical protein DEA96_18950, partial [Leptospiraceae bacterium]|nr:hypothetical protein [Leptospiraceae bacterium]
MSATLWQRRICYFLLAFAGLLCLRVFFLIYNDPSSPVSAGDTTMAFLRGLRFDLATVPLILLPGMIAAFTGMLVALVLTRKPGMKRTAIRWSIGLETSIHLLGSAFLTGLGLSSAYNYRFNGRHLGWEFSAYMTDLPMLARSSLDQSLVFSLLLILVVVLLIGLAFWLPIRLDRKIEVKPGREILHISVWILLFLVIGRGGFQTSPIRTADALVTGNAYLDQLSLNGIFTVSRDLGDRDQFRPVVDREVAVDVVRTMLDGSDAFISQEFPLLRYMEPRQLGDSPFSTRLAGAGQKPGTTVPGRPNIVLLILESGS